ncbi:hypothetical protein PHAVU_011G060600 [Phaseolus vulgaris]|uniref:Uncharacterized protein n=1 Tax=Phaseolus vulgaris TaxID=3885 RepID=V7AIT7_PHAVU|nr:hypothetical protein PHAVU_011G060600g [Phaseolus vulgaris]ESW04021.1 hypothetical protein PHAVU_011G060600g [Phaseolus vulgaris]
MSILPPSPRTNQTNEPDLKPREFRSFTTSLPCSTHPYTQHNTMLQDQLKFDFSANHSHHLDSLWDSNTSPQSTLSSTLSSIQGSPEGSSSSSSSSSQEPSPTSQDFCWESTYDTMEMLEKMKLDERDSSEYHYGYVNQRLEASNVGLYSLLQEQIRSIQLSWTRQEEILSQKQDPTAYGGKIKGRYHSNFRRKLKELMLGVITEEGLAHHCSTLVHTSRLVHILGLGFSFLVEKLVPLSGHVRDQMFW